MNNLIKLAILFIFVMAVIVFAENKVFDNTNYNNKNITNVSKIIYNGGSATTGIDSYNGTCRIVKGSTAQIEVC